VIREDRLLDFIFKRLSDDPTPTLHFLLLTLDREVVGSRRVSMKDKSRILTGRYLEGIRRLYGRKEDDELPLLADRMLRSLLLSSSHSPLARRPLSSRSIGIVLYLLRALSFTTHLPQRQLLLDLLASSPPLVEPFIRRLEHVWEAKPSLPSLNAATAFCQVLREAPAVVPFLPAEGVVDDDAITVCLSGILPPSLTKKELTKAVLSQDPLTQRAGLLLIYQMLDRVHRASSQLPSTASQAIRLATSHRLPDLQALLSLRARLDSSSSNSSGKAKSSQEEDGASENHVAEALYALVLRVLRR